MNNGFVVEVIFQNKGDAELFIEHLDFLVDYPNEMRVSKEFIETPEGRKDSVTHCKWFFGGYTSIINEYDEWGYKAKDFAEKIHTWWRERVSK